MPNPFSRFFRRRKPDPPESSGNGVYLLSSTLQVLVPRDPVDTFSERAAAAMKNGVERLATRIGNSIYVINADGNVEAHEIPTDTPIQ